MKKLINLFKTNKYDGKDPVKKIDKIISENFNKISMF